MGTFMIQYACGHWREVFFPSPEKAAEAQSKFRETGQKCLACRYPLEPKESGTLETKG